MPPYSYVTADVFTDRVFGGNQLAVFPEPGDLSPDQMQAVARELNLSETVFVFPPERREHTRRLRIFTPGSELPFAGHPTIGTAYVLAATGAIPLDGEETRIVFEEGVGPVPVSIHASGGRPTFAQLTAAQTPEFRQPSVTRETVAGILSVSAEELARGSLVPHAVSCGVPFLLVPLRHLGALSRARLDRALWEQRLAGSWAPHLFPFVLTETGTGADVRARMFAPAMGIPEDPATGAAAAALAGYLAVRHAVHTGTLRWTLEQGIEMGRPSRIHIEADRKEGEVTAVRVGGKSVLVGEGVMELPQ